jgi:hypothetical protein
MVAIAGGREHVQAADVSAASMRVLREMSGSFGLKHDYDRAVAAPRGPTRHKDVLHACALASNASTGTFSARDVRRIALRVPTGEDVPNVIAYLRQFASTSGLRGRILENVGGPGRYQFKFLDPLMPTYVLLRAEAEGRVAIGESEGDRKALP